VTNPH